LRAKTKSAFLVHKTAVDMEYRSNFKEETGKSVDAGSRKFGRPKRKSRRAQTEFDATKKITRGKRRR
jgi:hypothetical protein